MPVLSSDENMGSGSGLNDPFADNIIESEVSRAFKKACAARCDELEINKVYYGIIEEVVYVEHPYPSILVRIKVFDEDGAKNIAQEFAFGGMYDDFNMSRLVKFLNGISGYQLNWIDDKNYVTIAESMQFLAGAKVRVIQKESSKGNKYYDTAVLGKYDSKQQKVIHD